MADKYTTNQVAKASDQSNEVETNNQSHQTQVESLFNSFGLTSGNITLTSDKVQITGTTPDNKRVVFKQERFGNYRSQQAFEYSGGDVSDRREHAKRLRKNGLTQKDIAEQLNVSQKTISNYLKDI